MIRITYSKNFEKQLRRVPQYIQDKVELWIWTIEDAGLRATQKAPGLHDEPLQGKRWGQRSMRLNKAYRLIYRVIKDEVHIELLEVHKHDY